MQEAVQAGCFLSFINLGLGIGGELLAYKGRTFYLADGLLPVGLNDKI